MDSSNEMVFHTILDPQEGTPIPLTREECIMRLENLLKRKPESDPEIIQLRLVLDMPKK
jgi:hypothetical protein